MDEPSAFAESYPLVLKSCNYNICNNKNSFRRNRRLIALARLAKRSIQQIPNGVPRKAKYAPNRDGLLPSDGDFPRNLNQLISALTTAGFSPIASPSPLELSPPHSQALPLRIRANASALRPLFIEEELPPVAPWRSLRNGYDDASGSFLVFVRGVSDTRTSGLLFASKIRSLEVAYQAPLASMRKRLLSFLSKYEADTLFGDLIPAIPHDVSNNAEFSDTAYIDTVRRVAPSGDIRNFFRAASSIEPTYRDVVLIYCPKKKESPRKKIKDALKKAINPVTTNVTAVHGPPLDDLRVEMYRDVPWGLLHHIFPNETQMVQPRARDLLRVDSLTLLGLVSTVVTYFRDADSPFVNIALAGTAFAYAFRIALGLQTAFSNYRARIIKHKFEFVVKKGGVHDVLSVIRNNTEYGT